MNNFSELKYFYKSLIKESGIREYLAKNILPAFSKKKALDEGLRRFRSEIDEDVLGAATRKMDDMLGNLLNIKANKNADPAAMALYKKEFDKAKNIIAQQMNSGRIDELADMASNDALKNVLIGTGGAAGLGALGYGINKKVSESEPNMLDQVKQYLGA